MSEKTAQILELIKETNLLTDEQLKISVDESKKLQKSLSDAICDLSFASLTELNSNLKTILELKYGVNYLPREKIIINEKLLDLFPKEVLFEHKFLPITKNGNIFYFGLTNPDSILAEREIKNRLKSTINAKICKAVILEEDYEYFINKFYPESDNQPIFEENTDELLSSIGIDYIETNGDDFDMADLSDSAQEAPIIHLANSLLGSAITKGVSDIHIEPREKELIVRFRQDGVLSVFKTLPKKIQNAVVSRYKIMSELDISERRLPQDGRIRVKMGEKFIDFRVSTLPSKFGEKVVMRILDKSNVSLGLEKLITQSETLNLVREMINRPFGIIFVTGPTGSGKTTTLYSALKERNTPGVNISTVEDPIEYDLDGITQTEVNKTIGLDFARALRAFLRQDPDIMLIGETRDKETAQIAIEAALTGHLVFTTLHTNDAPSSIMRLNEMEIEPFLISSSAIGIIAQRLLRKICPHCKEEYTVEKETVEFLGIKNHNKFYRGKGCDKCSGTGYKGRIGAYEVLKINDNLRELIANNANTSVIKLAAQESGMKTLLEYSIELAKEGLTSLDEIIRVTFTNEGSSSLCPGCGKPIGEEYYKCPFCQYELKTTCPRCSMIVEKNWSSCSKCGYQLKNVPPDTICKHCGGEISTDMHECPWCYKILKIS